MYAARKLYAIVNVLIELLTTRRSMITFIAGLQLRRHKVVPIIRITNRVSVNSHICTIIKYTTQQK